MGRDKNVGSAGSHSKLAFVTEFRVRATDCRKVSKTAVRENRAAGSAGDALMSGTGPVVISPNCWKSNNLLSGAKPEQHIPVRRVCMHEPELA